MDKPNIVVEVVYALADKQKLLRLSLPYGTTVRQAAVQSGMQAHFPDLDLHNSPLIADPKEVRKQRAAKAAQAKAEDAAQ